MNNKQSWEEEFEKEWEKDEMLTFKQRIKNFISQREAEIRKETIEDYLKSEEGKVYQDYQTMKKQAENDVRKETILAVLPKSKRFKDHDIGNASDYGFNSAVKEIKDKAKEKFNITI